MKLRITFGLNRSEQGKRRLKTSVNLPFEFKSPQLCCLRYLRFEIIAELK
jgi:hypothetical protein